MFILTPQRSSVTSVFLLRQALYNEYVHFKETEIPAKELEKGHTEHLYKLLEVRMNRGRTENNVREGKREQSVEMQEKVTNIWHHVRSSRCIMGFSLGGSGVCQ